MKITKKNLVTNKENTLELDVTASQYHDWEMGMHAQNAFPNLTADEREFIISGMLPGEFDKLFSAEEKDEDEFFEIHKAKFKVTVGKDEFDIEIVTNMPGLGLDVEEAFNSWLLRTKEFTAHSLCEYINDKQLCDVICVTKEAYDAMPEEY
jgi:hypothetical protein